MSPTTPDNDVREMLGDTQFKCESCSEKREHRHLARLQFSEKLIRQMFRPTPPGVWMRITRGLPAGAKLLTGIYRPEMRNYEFIYEHPDFPSVPDDVSPLHSILVEMEQWIPDMEAR